MSESSKPNLLESIPSDSYAVELEFIKAYENLPILWDRRNSDYSNKYKRNAAYDVLVVILKKLCITATRLHVRQKINILRSGYRKDLRKHASKTIGPNGYVYEYAPQNWKYRALKFLEVNSNDTIDDTDVTDADTSVAEVNASYEEPASDTSASDNGEPASEPEVFQIEKPKAHKRPSKRVKHEQEVEPANDFYFVEADGGSMDREYEAIGANVTCKLKRMSSQQRCHAELLINKVLIYGLQNNLTDDTDLTEVYTS